MKKAIIKTLSVFLAVILSFAAAPISGFIGVELPEWLDFSITSSAAETSGAYGDNLNWAFDNSSGTLTISGTGEMQEFELPSDAPWFSHNNDVKKIQIADGVTTIGKNAFKKLTKLIHVEIGNDVTTIGEFAFNGCYTIDTVIIGSDVTQICDSAFSACNSLNYIYYMGTETEYNKVDWYEINEEEYDAIWFRVRYIFIEDIETDSGKCGGNLTWTYDVPACTLTISGTGDMDDYNYDKMPPWYQWRFFIKNVVMEEGITKIGELSFNGCDKLETAIIPDGVKIINNGAFNTCYSLKAITIPDSVTTINYGAFSSCSSIISVAMGSGVASIGEYAFAGCDSVIEYTVDNDNQYFSTDEYGVLFNKDKTFLIQYTNGNTRTAYSIPDTVISIGYMSFNNAKNLTDVTFGKSVTTIDKAAFERCSNLSSVTIPKSLTSVDFAAFDECFNIKNVYYWGTEHEWYNMNVSRYNEPLLNATIHFLGEEFHECSYNAVVTPPTCKEQGYTTYTCECGNSYIDDYVDALGHTPADEVEENYVAPTCTETGSKEMVVYCSVCDEEISRETETLDLIGHNDSNDDGNCDECDEELEFIVLCDHNCHKGGIAGFFWKIANFFNKLFGLKQYCECGEAHY